MTQPIRLAALDAANPIAFLAALGVLNAVADANHEARLVWEFEDAWRPFLEGSISDLDTLVGLLDEDRQEWASEPALGLRYGKKGKEVRDLKAPPAELRAFFMGLLTRQPFPSRSLAFAASFATETAQDNSGNSKPTALHFTAGQQQFLDAVDTLRDSVTREDFREALLGPWRYDRKVKGLNWDAAISRDYALRARDPSDEKLIVPGCDWLAFRGLSFFPLAANGSRVETPCCHGGWKTGTFRWPLWNVPADRETVRSLLVDPGISQLSEAGRRLRGVSVVFESSIRRSDQGGYGSFSPARPIAAA